MSYHMDGGIDESPESEAYFAAQWIQRTPIDQEYPVCEGCDQAIKDGATLVYAPFCSKECKDLAGQS